MTNPTDHAALADDAMVRAHASWMMVLGKMDGAHIVMTTQQAHEALRAAIQAYSQSDDAALPDDVRRLVIAGREAWEDATDAHKLKRLDEALEAFASRVPYDDEPADITPPHFDMLHGVIQPVAAKIDGEGEPPPAAHEEVDEPDTDTKTEPTATAALADELLPCPFCGHLPEGREWHTEHKWFIQCSNSEYVYPHGCPVGPQMSAVTREKAEAQWNTRATCSASSPPQDMEALRLPWRADPDYRPGYEWNWHVYDADDNRVCFMANGPHHEAKVQHLCASANATLATPAQSDAVALLREARAIVASEAEFVTEISGTPDHLDNDLLRDIDACLAQAGGEG